MAKSYLPENNNAVKHLPMQQKMEALEILYQKIHPHLSPAESMVLNFIYMRTYKWGKVSEHISFKHFLEGIFTHEGESLLAGLNMSRRTLGTCLNSLKDKGVIFATEHKKNNGQDDMSEYRMNMEWTSMLKMPKRLKTSGNPEKNGGCKSCQGGVQNLPEGGAKFAPLKYINKIHKDKQVERQAEPAHTEEDILSAISTAKGRATASRLKKVERARSNPQSVASLFTVWEHALRTHFPDYPVVQPWTRKQLGQMADFRTAFGKSNTGASVAAFVEFCVQHWRRIGVLQFANLKNGSFPLYPDIGFLMGMKRGFLTSFADNDFAGRTAKFTEADRKTAKLLRQGYTQAEAERAVQQDTGSRRALDQQLAENDRARLDNIALKRKLEDAKRDNRDLRELAAVGAKERVLAKFEKAKMKINIRDGDAELQPLPGWCE